MNANGRKSKLSRPRWVAAWLFVSIIWFAPFDCSFGQGEHGQPLRFLSERSNRDALQICQEYLMEKRRQKGLSEEDLSDMVVTNRFTNKHNRVTHLYFKQRHLGLDVHGANYSAAVDAEGRIIFEDDTLMRATSQRRNRVAASITAEQALRAAAKNLELDSNAEVHSRAVAGGRQRETTFSVPAISRDEVTVKLSYVVVSVADLRLAWEMVIRTPDGRHWWHVFIDAESGQMLEKINWIVRDSYQVIPLPNESPSLASRSIVSGVPDAIASPFGWHDTNGIDGAEFTDTRGNNVFAQEDADGDDAGGLRPDGGPDLFFNPPLNPQLQPSANVEAATVNLFYWTNILHDVLYRYGFDELAGNFQQNNYAFGAAGGDPVLADSQDGIDLNNAQFGTPPDGTNPRMEMFLWDASSPTSLVITAPATVAGSYAANSGAFGAWTTGISGSVVLALDDANAIGPSTTDGCTSITNVQAITGNIAMVDRGDCLFVEKVANLQAAGAIGVIIVNNAGDDLVNMAGQDPSLTIPPVFIGQSDGSALKAQLADGLTATLVVGERRDSSFDNGIVAHEYAHGLTNRLTGGASNTSCLANAQSRGMGEGWSDWLALTMTARPADSPIIPRAIGTYVSGEPTHGPGIRNYPYTRDLGVNPLLFSDMGSVNQPHGVGEIWASALWDLYWNLVAVYGFDENLYAGTGGNNILMQLVIDALKMQPCNPDFLQARDSIITADAVTNQAANQCLIWEAFARRGMGASSVAFNSNTLGGTEAFDLPATCIMQCGNNLLDVGEQCDDGNHQAFDGCSAQCRVETPLVELFGTASGGTINLILEGVTVSVNSSPGQTATAAAAAVVDSINANTALQAIHAVAVNDEGRIVVTGTVESIEINDAGLSTAPTSQQVPFDPRVLLIFSVLCIYISWRYQRN